MGDYTPVVDSVTPAYFWVPDHAGTHGDEILDFNKQCGLTFDPEQELAINAMACHDKQGNWVAGEVCIIEPRQNGKTMRIVLPLTLADLFLFPPDEMMHTAHRFPTARKTFEAMKRIIDGNYDLRREVAKITSSHGQESILLHNGAMLMFIARSEVGGRGLGGKRVDFDEAFAVQSNQLGALVPTMAARPNSQLVYSSSAGLARSDALRAIRDRGRKMNDPGLVYIEFCAPGSWKETGCASQNCNHLITTEGCSLDKMDFAKQANPALNRRITPAKIEMMRRSMTASEFGREIFGWWDEVEAIDAVPIKKEEWDECRDIHSKIVGSIVIAFDVSPDRRTACISVAGYNSNRAIHAELIKYERGTNWVVPELLRLKRSHTLLAASMPGNVRKPLIICDPSGPAASLIPSLNKNRIDPYLTTAREMGSACGGLQDAVTEGRKEFVHIGQQQVDLAILSASKRTLGDGAWAFGRKLSANVDVDICPATTIALARWGVTVAAQPVAAPRAAWS